MVPESIKIEAVAYAVYPKAVIVAIDKTITRFGASSVSPRHDFETRLRRASPQLMEIHPEGDFVNGVVVTIHPLEPEEQGFTDENGESYDYALRYFAPWIGVDEHPATGCCSFFEKAQALLSVASHRSGRLSWAKTSSTVCFFLQMRAPGLQAYPKRGAEFRVSMEPNDRVAICGKAVTMVSGTVHLNGAEYSSHVTVE